jgi:hypothetical protein
MVSIMEEPSRYREQLALNAPVDRPKRWHHPAAFLDINPMFPATAEEIRITIVVISKLNAATCADFMRWSHAISSPRGVRVTVVTAHAATVEFIVGHRANIGS